jgi:hypothetical protein
LKKCKIVVAKFQYLSSGNTVRLVKQEGKSTLGNYEVRNLLLLFYQRGGRIPPSHVQRMTLKNKKVVLGIQKHC